MSAQELSILPSYNLSVGQIPQCAGNPSGSSSIQGSPPDVNHGSPPCVSPGTPPEPVPSQQSIQSGSTPIGYPTLASRMSLIPEVAVFRRFGALNAQNLLYLQAELQDMEQSLRDLQIRDSNSTGEASWHSVNWWYLAHAGERGTDSEQWELVQEIRKKLNEYNKAIIQQHHILRMPPPGKKDLSYLQKFLEADEMGPSALTGDDSSIWGHVDEPDKRATDLVALLSRHDEDPFSTWVTEKAVSALINVKWFQSKELLRVRGLRGCKDSTLIRTAGMITSVVASALPILSIVILYFVKSLEARIGVISFFNLLLSFCMTIFTKAKRTEIFATAAAFSAVQVVFVQVGTNSG